MKELLIGVGVVMVGLLFALGVHATAPSIPFGELARRADCVVVGEFGGADSEDKRLELVFELRAIVAGADCSSKRIEVRELSSEDTSGIRPGSYLLFLKKRPTGYSYAQSAFSLLPIRNGTVDTLFFPEMEERIPLEEVLRRIHRQRRLNAK